MKAIVPEVDVDGGRVVVTPPDGLFEPLPEEPDEPPTAEPRPTPSRPRRAGEPRRPNGPDVRLDVVTIFPEFFAALDVSLLGKARTTGLLDVHVHDLRDATHDRHRTVDDTPYGGGAGMVMKPEPWGEALDGLLARRGRPARRLPDAGRHAVRPGDRASGSRGSSGWSSAAAATRASTSASSRTPPPGPACAEISLGDFVLNGGEVAVLAIVEAVARLLPGVIGNPESLAEESHEDGLLEYPSYTKPAVWRDREVPPVLRSGDHGAVARWRHEQSVERTRRVRPTSSRPSSSRGSAV